MLAHYSPHNGAVLPPGGRLICLPAIARKYFAIHMPICFLALCYQRVVDADSGAGEIIFWWLVAGGWWLVAGGWWLVAGALSAHQPSATQRRRQPINAAAMPVARVINQMVRLPVRA
ncbi:hypothetical protein BTJ39_17090 [Izhakiella australiensis]|uniref:Uncharacterized protein n=1 Tax=Izhakiella australiensis TaxID=1926881 RepID=A0A1S8YI98_9GAMM|nr:hypothetical protein BTJ39_17090 [Izhakiella australiensis]